MSHHLRVFIALGSLLLCGAGCTQMLRADNAIEQPMDRAFARDKKLTFGLYVTPDPEQNPIDPPERFVGYHAALDYEVFENELGQDVPIYAICNGEAVYSQYVEGYGGTFIQQCKIDGGEVTVLYGHLDQESIGHEVGDALKAGEQIGILGEHKTPETSDNRMHLHLGIHKGTDIQLPGYVQSEAELAAYLDPAEVLGY